MNELRILLKNKKVLEVQMDKGKVFLHFDDLVFECKNPHVSFIEERIPWSEVEK